MKKLVTVILSLVLLLAVCASATAAVKIPTTITETGIDLNFKAPVVDMSGAKFLEVSNLKLETTETGYVVTGDFSQMPDWAEIYSSELEDGISLVWDEEKQAYISDKLLEADDLEVSFGGVEWDENDDIITYAQLTLDAATLELAYAMYENQTTVYHKWSDGEVGHDDKATGAFASMNPETGTFSYSDDKINYWKNDHGAGYQNYETDAYLWIGKTYSSYSIPTGENESMSVEFMPNGKLSSYTFSSVDESGSTFSYTYNRYGQLTSANYYLYDEENEENSFDYYWYDGAWYDWNTDEEVQCNLEVPTGDAPYAEPYIPKAPAQNLADADLNNGTVYDAIGNVNGEQVEGYIYDDGIVSAFYSKDGKLYDYSYSNYDGSKFVRYNTDGVLQYADVYLADGTNYWYYEGQWKTLDPKTGEVIVLEGQPESVDLSDMAPLKATANKPERIWFTNNTLGLAGVSLKDLGISSDWHNVAPVDLTKDGTTVFTLVGADAWILGQAYVTVADGNVTVDYAILDGHGYMKEEKLNWFLSKADLTEENLKAESNYAFGEPVSIADQLGGAETAILFIDSKITFRQPYFDAFNYSTRYYRNRENWKEYREALIEMIGE